jgi:hypothetical protein
MIQAHTVCVICSVAGIAQQQDIGSVGAAADGAWRLLLLDFVFGVLLEPLSKVEVLCLFLVLYAVAIDRRACMGTNRSAGVVSRGREGAWTCRSASRPR